MLVDDACFTESAAILRFLAQGIPELRSYYSTDLVVAQKTDSALDYHMTFLKPKMQPRMNLLMQ